MKLSASRLEPVFVPRIWGARALAPLLSPQIQGHEPIGEVWLAGNECCFADGPFTGQKLGDAWDTMPVEWTGSRLRGEGPFPLLVKFILPEDKLSVQVHPDDDYARRHESRLGGIGKTEMWYAVSARPGAEVRVGLKPDVTPESFREAIEAGTVEDCLERIPVRAGDVIFVPAGTAHTIGPGVVLCEIQENSDITYRVYDYDRLTPEGTPRPLHVAKALAVIHFGEQSGGKIEPVRITRGPVTETYLIACRYFATERWEFAERIAGATSAEHFDLLIVLAGNGRIESGDVAADYGPAQAWLLPAALGAYQLEPASPTTLLRTYVPDVHDFVRRLADQRVEEKAWSRLVYP
ncbi:MAG: class I mannose-6-phosphate isomerase [Acidobacteria bacterium]|nr:class I mannose-6-phosphate isomerase [Acidobacteriota bacterium]